MVKKKIVVALSGAGRTLWNLIQYTNQHQSFEICGVIISTDKALGKQVALDHGLSVYKEKFSNSSKASDSLSQWLEHKNPDLIVLAGFLKIFPTRFLGEVSYKTINIHPSLLPEFSGKGMYGNKVHEAVLQAGEKYSGASVHFVSEIYDEGPIIAQIKVPVLEGDTPESLASRVFEAECQLYPEVIEGLLEGKILERIPFVEKTNKQESIDAR